MGSYRSGNSIRWAVIETRRITCAVRVARVRKCRNISLIRFKTEKLVFGLKILSYPARNNALTTRWYLFGGSFIFCTGSTYLLLPMYLLMILPNYIQHVLVCVSYSHYLYHGQIRFVPLFLFCLESLDR